MKRIISFALLALTLVLPIRAIEPTWEINMGGIFDNREGDDKMYEDKTFFMVTLAPEIGLKFTAHDRIAGGAVWNQPLENGVKDSKVMPTLYYRHDAEQWKFSFGMFPRTQLREKLPNFLWCDSLAYFQRNIRGALVQYQHARGFFDAYVDWRQMQTETRREAFNIVFHGDWHPKSKTFLLGTHLMMNHYAKTRHAGPEESIVDNFLVNPYLGFDFSHKTALDSLKIRVGLLQTIERNRGNDDGWRTPGGGWLEMTGEWRFLGLRNTLYAGGELLPSYGEFGPALYPGESYYQTSFYNRTDVYAKIIKNEYMSLDAELNFNFAKDNFMFYQRIILDIHIGNLTSKTGRKERVPNGCDNKF